MNIHVKYFGLLTEVTGCSVEVFEFEGKFINDFLIELYKKHPALRSKDFKVAQAQELVKESELITGEEIALLPPFSGG